MTTLLAAAEAKPAGGAALTDVALLGGRGGTLGPLLVWMPVQIAMTLAVDGRSPAACSER